MKYEPLAWLGVALLAALGACKTTALPLPRQQTIAELEAQQAAQEAAGDAAGAAATEALIAQEIADGAAETAHGILGPLSPLIPGGPLIEAGVAGLAWLLFPRPRKHALRALKGINPYNRDLTPVDSVKSIAAAFGLAHSSPESAKAAEESLEKPKPPTG